MEQPVFSGTAHDPAGATFAVIGVSNRPADWAQIFRVIGTMEPAADGQGGPDGPPAGADGAQPGVLGLNAYLLYAVGKHARRRLTERLGAHGLRLWHLTVMDLLAELGPQAKGALAARLDMNASDLVKVVNELTRRDYVVCVRDTDDRRRILVLLTPAGKAALDRINAEIATADEDLLAPLSAADRTRLTTLLQRVHGHLAPAPAPAPAPDPPAARS
ncbi:MarR family transcriptional regulator [Streptomyces venezuelae]|uniref:MarR family transcriptional regulator n=1 Tax=Streptomyces venezuelae TaxID=54571 RepID=A0A5P2DAT5_STRVZ|nr:winged helix DNA-binding protein [Streptomyces venezuelae]QES51317.1 MarR family transcriptional regulator [Streptomyces venezuelae]